MKPALAAAALAFPMWPRAAAAQTEDHDLSIADWQDGSSGVPAAPEPPADEQKPSSAQRGAAIASSIVPGTGHLALGKPKTATRLLGMEGAGVVLAVGGAAALALTGASRYFVGPVAAVTIAGAGLFGVSWLADVYGTAVPPETRGQAPEFASLFTSELGYRYVYDPQFRYRNFLVESFDLRLSSFRIAPSVWIALDDSNARYRLLGAYRFFGPKPAERSPDGSFLDLELAGTEHRYDSDGFRSLTGEVFLGGRMDLSRMDRELRGMFLELGFGWGISAYDYDVPGLDFGEDTFDLLLGRFAFGTYIGDPSRVGGEARLFYDHRHDDYAAGTKLTGLGSGVAGHFGIDGRFFFSSEWGIGLEAMAGSAYVLGGSVLFRQGGKP